MASYTNYLARMRATNYLNSLPNSIETPINTPIITNTNNSPPGIHVLAQYRMKNKAILPGNTFDLSPESMVCLLPFNPGTLLEKRLFRISTQLILVDPTPDCVGHIFLAITHNNKNVFNLCHEYTTGPSTFFSEILSFDTYIDYEPEHEPETLQLQHTNTIAIHATGTSHACAISVDRGPYSITFPAGISTLTIEDLGKLVG